jgi:hypothetical protein
MESRIIYYIEIAMAIIVITSIVLYLSGKFSRKYKLGKDSQHHLCSCPAGAVFAAGETNHGYWRKIMSNHDYFIENPIEIEYVGIGPDKLGNDPHTEGVSIGQWYYKNKPTGVGHGGWNVETCGTTGLYCAGADTDYDSGTVDDNGAKVLIRKPTNYGGGGEQIEALVAAIKNGGIHPEISRGRTI